MSLSNIGELRSSLTGNKDLKFKLFRDPETLTLLQEAFDRDVYLLVQNAKPDDNSSEFARLLDDLESRAVIAKMVCLFSNELESLYVQILALFQPSVASITSFFKFYMEFFLPLVYQGGRDWRPDLVDKFERITSDLLDILLTLLTHRRHRSRLDGEISKVLWRWVTTISVIAPANGSKVDELSKIVEDEAIFFKLLNLVPLLLFDTECKDARDDEFRFNVLMDGSDDDSVRIVTLLSVLVKILTKECDKIYFCHFPGEQLNDSDEAELDKATFQDPNLPNIEPNIECFKKSVQIETLHGLICCIAQIFLFLKDSSYNISDTQGSTKSIGILPPKVHLSLLLLLKYEDINLNLVTLNLIYFFLNNLTIENKLPPDLVFRNYQKLFPRINELISIDEPNATIPQLLLSPCKILAQLCTDYPLINNDLRKGNLEIKLIEILDSLCKTSPQLKLFKTLKKQSVASQKIIDFDQLTVGSGGGGGLLFDDKRITNLPDLMLLLSVYCSKKEEYRSRVVTAGKIADNNHRLYIERMVFEIIDNYRFLLSQIQMIHLKICHGKNSPTDLQYLGKLLSLMTSLLNDLIYTNALYLIRSLSRSVALLRTFFVKCNHFSSTFKKIDRSGFSNADTAGVSHLTSGPTIISAAPSGNSSLKNYSTEGGFTDNLLHVLKGIENCSLILNLYVGSVSHADTIVVLSKTMTSNKSILLKILANLVLDFSSLRFHIIHNGEFLSILMKTFNNSRKVHNLDHYKRKEEVELESQTIQYNILQVMQNYTFNENDENKAKLMGMYKYECIFEKIAYGMGIENDEIAESDATVNELRLQQKVHSLDVLRNLTSGSQYFCQKIQKEYSEWRKTRPGFAGIGWYSFLYKNLSQGLEIYGLGEGYDVENDKTLMELCKNESYTSLLLAINYIEDHKYTNIENFKENLKNREKLFRLWLNFLKLNIPKEFEKDLDINVVVNMNNNLSLIQVSICWIIINLTWKSKIFGSRRTDSVHFKIYDTVLIGGVNGRIDIDSEDDEDEDGEDEDDESDRRESEYSGNFGNDEEKELYTSVSNRAMFLKRFGFLSVLDQLIKKLSGGNKELKDSERFDSMMGNDLLEKARSAKNQILELTGGTKVEMRRRTSGSKKKETEGQTAPQRTSRPDVNRGGEGYGYETDSEQEYVDTMENNESDMEGIEEFDETWIR